MASFDESSPLEDENPKQLSTRSKSLHSFDLPLAWGNRKRLECRLDTADSDDNNNNNNNNRKSLSSDQTQVLDQVSGVRIKEKLLSHLRTPSPKDEDALPVPSAEKPWNLRTRRAACKAPKNQVFGKSFKLEERRPVFNFGSYSPRKDKDKERKKFSNLLTVDEIKEDFLFMTGAKPPRRPMRRPRAVQKQIDNLYPGFWLTEVTPDRYKTADEPEIR